MDIIDLATIQSFHRERIERFGVDSSRALGWKADENQRQRFDVLASLAKFSGFSVLDVGCGSGELSARLRELYVDVHYTGIDQMQAFLDVALARYGTQPNTRFLLGDFSTGVLAQYDYILACGAMSYRSSNPDFVPAMIRRLFAASRYGFGFNLLRRVDFPDGILCAYDPAEILALCRELTPNVVLSDDYHADDFTIFMYQQNP